MNFKKLPYWLWAALAVFLLIFLFHWPQDSEQWASWVQAAGTVLALGIAIYLSKQERDERKSEREQDRAELRRQRAYDLSALAVELHRHVVELKKYTAPGQNSLGVYFAELMFFKDAQGRLNSCATGAASEGHKNAAMELRKLCYDVLPYLMARTGSKGFDDVDWDGIERSADKLAIWTIGHNNPD